MYAVRVILAYMTSESLTCRMASSIVPAVTNRYICTFLRCPSLQMRLMAWWSTDGFQSTSNITRREAPTLPGQYKYRSSTGDSVSRGITEDGDDKEDLQVDTHATGLRGEQEEETRVVHLVEPVDQSLALVHRHPAVQPQTLAPATAHRGVDLVQRGREVRDDHHLLVGGYASQHREEPHQYLSHASGGARTSEHGTS